MEVRTGERSIENGGKECIDELDGDFAVVSGADASVSKSDSDVHAMKTSCGCIPVFFLSVAFGSSRIGSSSCWARIVTFAGEAVSCFVVNWSERRGLSFHFSTWLVGKSRRDIFLFVDYWCESKRSFTSLLFGLLGLDLKEKGFSFAIKAFL